MDSDSIYHCYLCNSLLNGKAKILNCLHVICSKCEERKQININLPCKCGIITIGELINYPIVLPKISKEKTCNGNNCNKLATKICIPCNSYYCKPCSKEHLNSIAGHKQKLIISYPTDNIYMLCPSCKEKYIEVCCTKCAVMICSLCHLRFHRTHNYKVLKHFSKEVKSNVSIEKVDLERNSEFLNQCLNNTEGQINKLETQKNAIYKDIDDKFELLKKELEKRVIKLKNAVNVCVANVTRKIQKNKRTLKNIKKNNKYLMDITESVLKHDNEYEILKLSKFITDKLKIASKNTLNLHNLISETQLNMIFEYEESLKNCISSIEAVGTIKSSFTDSNPIVKMDQELSETNLTTNTIVTNNVQNSVFNLNIVTPNISSTNLPMCSCCNQWSLKLTKCNSCQRYYHSNCHIPSLEKLYHETLRNDWKCTMCSDIIIEPNSESSIINDIYADKNEWKIIERILMELFCQIDDGEFYRYCPNREIYPEYYEKISNPISLNDIKKRLESDIPYESLIDFIIDVKLIFSNGKSYFHESDPYYKSATDLENVFNSMLTSFLPELHYVIDN